MSYVSVNDLIGGAILGQAEVRLPLNDDPVTIMVPAEGAAVHVYVHGTTTPVQCYSDTAGTTTTQPLSVDAEGNVIASPGVLAYVQQPGTVDVAVSGGPLASPKTIPAGHAPTLLQINTSGLSSAQIDSALPTNVTAADGMQIHDATNHLLLVREGGKWYKTAALTQIA